MKNEKNETDWVRRVVCALIVVTIQVVTPLNAQERQLLTVPGLEQEVEILKDVWGVSHIYAETEHDLFFAQGWNAARDRLFQLEIWRLQATGTAAAVFGSREVTRDRAARLFKFRDDMTAEMRHYHPRGDQIIPSFVEGINAYIDHTRQNPELLPLEFGLLGIEPQHWTPEVVISRHQGLLGNAGNQLDVGRAVHLLGAERVKDLQHFHPIIPDIELDPAVDGQHLIDHDILELYNTFRSRMAFRPEDIVVPGQRNDSQSFDDLSEATRQEFAQTERFDFENYGSNSWVVSGSRAQDDFPLMVNDPHRAQHVPALRYMVHLVGPGWDVVGAGEPSLPGISIGHNGQGAWGLTVFRIDHEDIFVYETNPANPNQYWYQGRWTDMQIVQDTVQVRDAAPLVVNLKYTRHGPVVYEDPAGQKAYGMGLAWNEVGGAPYLASLRMNQAMTWDEFRDASSYSHVPGENMMWADRAGNIGWQAVGIAPIRRNFSGLVPIPGDGRYEWSGFLPIKALPHLSNPPEGYIATANANLTSPFEYEHLDDAIYFLWTDPFRQNRIKEVLESGRRFNLMDMVRLQHDYLSIPARTLVPLLRNLESGDAATEDARQRLLRWDFQLEASSVEAGIYVAWEREMLESIQTRFIPETAQEHISVGMRKMIDLLLSPPGEFGPDPLDGRDRFLLETLRAGVDGLRERLGGDMERWQYGQEAYKHALIQHPLGNAVGPELRDRLNVGPAPRGGNSFTVGNTAGGDNQTSGASFRIFVDTRDWDASLAMNNPGQVGDPDSPFFDNLFDRWANDEVFPLFYSRPKIEGVAAERLELRPGS